MGSERVDESLVEEVDDSMIVERMDTPLLQVQRLNERAVVPRYQTEGSAGMDLSCNRATSLIMLKGRTYIIPTGLAVKIPNGYEGQIRARSGLATQGFSIVNSPGTIDSDYRGEIRIICALMRDEALVIEPGQRIAQMVIASVVQARIEVVSILPPTERGTGGFGSTGE